MKTLAIYLAKRYALDALEKITETNKEKIASASAKVTKWIAALKGVTEFLDKLNARLADGVLTTEEASETMAGAESLAEEVKAELAA